MFKYLRQTLFSNIQTTHSLLLMNLAQLGAIINDNIYKFTMVFLLIDLLGHQEASSILSLAGAIFVVPFLLFSSAAGILADRFSKKWILTVMKIVETLVFLSAIPIFLIQNVFGCYFLLFLLATHSAVFGPSKYGIIPELVNKEAVPKANSLITSTTYLGIIAGAFLGSFLSDITGKRYIIVMIFCICLAVLGLLCSLAIQHTPRQGSSKKPSPLFFLEIYRTFEFCREIRYLRVVILGSAFFLFIGAFTQLSIIPYAIESLHLDEIVGGYLFLCTALGIALGAYLSSKIIKSQIDLAIPCLACFGLGILLVTLFFFAGHVSLVILSLCLLGTAGGLFVVPLDSFTQLASPNERRGQVIAVANFLGFVGVLIASFCLYFLGSVLKLSPATSFGIMGILTIVFSFAFCFRLSEFMVQFLARKLTRHRISLQNAALFTKSDERPLLILQHGTWKKLFYLCRIAPDYHFLLSTNTRLFYRVLARLCYHLHLSPPSSQALLENARLLQKSGTPICIILPYRFWLENPQGKSSLLAFFNAKPQNHLIVNIQLPLSSKDPTTITFSEE